jgi:hypothetical protein
MDKVDRPTTRRALLAAAAGGAAALAAQAALPLAAAAHDPDDVLLGAANSATATTSIDTAANAVDTFAATAGGATGSAIVATKTGAAGSAVVAKSANEAGVYAVSGDATNAAAADVAASTGVYGFSPVAADPDFVGTGVWGDSEEIGVYGTGSVGVEGDATIPHDVGVVGWAGAAGTIGVLGIAAGSATPSTVPPQPASIGVHARADAVDRTALKVTGKVAFSRSGKTAIAKGASSKVITLAGVTTSSLIFAVLATNRSGRWVRAVVPATGKFTIYLNTTISTASVGTTYLVWWIIN